MNELTSFLDAQGFTKAAKIETLKVTLSPVKHEDANVDIPSPDKRYYWDGKVFGLHVSNVEWEASVWDTLIALLTKNKAKIEVLYLGNTDREGLSVASFPVLRYLNLFANHRIKTLTLKDCPQLASLSTYGCDVLQKIELRGTFLKLEKLDVSYCPSLSELLFPTHFPKLRFLHAIETKLENDYIALRGYFDGELREKLTAFLKLKGLLKDDVLIPPNRYQVIFIGNTTAGKTELRLALTNTKRDSDDEGVLENKSISTHGVHIFQHPLGEQEVLGYDFGGQDYYHALHLPFYDDKTLYVLVWGNYHGWAWGSGDPDEFGMKKETIEIDGKATEVENILYPMPYWLGSLIYQQNKTNPSHSEKETTSNDNRKLEIIQNLRAENTNRFYLNTRALKTHERLDVGDIVDFDIFTQKTEVKTWLEKRILDRNLLDTQPVSQTIYEFGKKLLAEDKAFYSAQELTEKFKTEAGISDEVEFAALAQSLHVNRLGFWRQPSAPFFIARLDLFSKFIHQILAKELATNDANAGYFTQQEAKKRAGLSAAETQFILDFLIDENVIFKVEEEDKYVAPAYLPVPKSKADILLLESFESADCYWEFEGYFHSNIILQIIDDKQGNLIYDPSRKEYLLWKNTILLYAKAGQHSNEYLLIQLEYPDGQNKLKKPDGQNELKNPRLSLSRNKAKFVSDTDFHQVFEYLDKKLGVFEKAKCWVKSPVVQKGFPEYIPLEVIDKCDKAGRGKFTHLVFYKNMYFNRFEFKHFRAMGTGAPRKVFVAYSKADDEFRAELRSHLQPYEKSGELIVFDDRNLELGAVWDAELRKQLAECDIFVCLVSINMLNTSYVVDLEIPEAKRLNKHIIPVILSPCNWYEEKFGLSQFNANDKGKVISLCYQNFGSENQSLQPLGKHERAEKWVAIVAKILEVAQGIRNAPPAS